MSEFHGHYTSIAEMAWRCMYPAGRLMWLCIISREKGGCPGWQDSFI